MADEVEMGAEQENTVSNQNKGTGKRRGRVKVSSMSLKHKMEAIKRKMMRGVSSRYNLAQSYKVSAYQIKKWCLEDNIPLDLYALRYSISKKKAVDLLWRGQKIRQVSADLQLPVGVVRALAKRFESTVSSNNILKKGTPLGGRGLTKSLNAFFKGGVLSRKQLFSLNNVQLDESRWSMQDGKSSDTANIMQKFKPNDVERAEQVAAILDTNSEKMLESLGRLMGMSTRAMLSYSLRKENAVAGDHAPYIMRADIEEKLKSLQKRKVRSKDSFAKFKRLYKDGNYSLREIANRCGVTYVTVINWRRLLGSNGVQKLRSLSREETLKLKKQAYEMYLSGMTRYKIANQLDVSLPTIYGWSHSWKKEEEAAANTADKEQQQTE